MGLGCLCLRKAEARLRRPGRLPEAGSLPACPLDAVVTATSLSPGCSCHTGSRAFKLALLSSDAASCPKASHPALRASSSQASLGATALYLGFSRFSRLRFQ